MTDVNNNNHHVTSDKSCAADDDDVLGELADHPAPPGGVV